MATDEKSLVIAACYDNKSFIEDYLACDDPIEDVPRDDILAKALHKAAEHCSVKVVEILINSPHGMYSTVNRIKEYICYDFTCINTMTAYMHIKHYIAGRL